MLLFSPPTPKSRDRPTGGELEHTGLHYSNEQIPRPEMDGKLPHEIAPVQSGSIAASTGELSNPWQSAKLEAIGMVRDSGHKVCGFKLLFATLLWSGFMGQIGLPIVSGIMINTFRADGNTFGTLQIIAGFLAIVFAAFAGSLRDSSLLQPVFDRLGCPREKYGRRAPHILIAIPLMSLPLLFVWHPPKWANVADKIDDSRKIQAASFVLPSNGLDCSRQLVVTDINGKNISPLMKRVNYQVMHLHGILSSTYVKP